jgi:uncharacterized RDD family membrane protein YckC
MVTLARRQPEWQNAKSPADIPGLRLFSCATRSCSAAVRLEAHLVPDRSFMKPRFEPDDQTAANDGFSPALIDPEAYDATEQKFAASLEQTGSTRPPKFVVEEKPSEVALHGEPLHGEPRINAAEAGSPGTNEIAAALSPTSVQEPPDHDSWRQEVAARLSHYRARRRTREPRYPSLRLKFESDQVWTPSAGAVEPLPPPAGTPQRASHEQFALAPRITLAEPADYPRILPAVSTETTAKVIDFASYSPAPRPLDELAEPVLDRPRIIEAPELVPLPPALGGILIEPVEEPASERRPGFEIPLQAAPMVRRIAAAVIDAALVVSAIAAFGYIFLRITAIVPPPGKVAGTAVFLVGLLWSAYQHLLLVYSGSTPGLKLARLELQRFDGSPVPRRLRCWRVLASVLSGVSLGLGYAWCLLDEDQLCWHDRITRTYMAPKR